VIFDGVIGFGRTGFDNRAHGSVQVRGHILGQKGPARAFLPDDVAPIGRVFARDEREQSRFSGSVAADKSRALAGLQVQRGAVEQSGFAVGIGDFVQGKQGHNTSTLPRLGAGKYLLEAWSRLNCLLCFSQAFVAPTRAEGSSPTAAHTAAMFRRHQDEFGQLCADLRENRRPQLKSVICATTPGGGKSLLPVIAAAQLIPAVADRIAWVVPRRSLQSQAESEFQKPLFRAALGHAFSIRRSTNEADPCRGHAGFATTYQAIGMANTHLVEEFRRHRYILILDEPHHVEEEGAWEDALRPLVQRAALTVYMSGTLERGNRKRIAFLPYRDTPDGEIIDLSASDDTAVISYSRADALEDHAVLPIHFELMDGTAQWIGRDGVSYSTQILQRARQHARGDLHRA
jgi:hypothetical protein